MSHGDLAAAVDAGAACLRAAGAAPGTRVLLGAREHGPDWVTGLLAALAADLSVVLPDPLWPEDERRRRAGALEPTFVLDGAGPPRRVASGAATADEGGGVWLFTSGTTAQPKPLFRSSAALAAMLGRLLARLPRRVAQTPPVALCALPLYHGYGLVNAFLLVQALGGTLAMAHDRPIEELPERMEEAGAGMFYGWPRHFRVFAGRGRWPRGLVLDWCVSSSSRLDPAVAARFLAIAGCPVRQQYGTTETGPLCLDHESPPSARPGCVGRPLDGIRIEVLGEDGAALPPETRGRIRVRLEDGSLAPHLAERDGSYCPGDLGFVDEAGRVFIERRAGPFFDERKNA